MSDEKKEVKKPESAPASEFRAEVKALIEELLPAIAVAARAGQQVSPQPHLPKEHAKLHSCQVCKQPQMACKDKHVMMAVYPRSGTNGRWFQGIWINGIKYLSQNSGHLIAVPEDNNINHIIDQFEKSEDLLKTNRGTNHNSGDVHNFRPNYGQLF